MKLSPWVLTATLTLFAASALAGDAPSCREEFVAVRAALFAEADADGDGALTQAEFATLQELLKRKWTESQFQRLDANNDDRVSSEEFVAAGEHRRMPPPW